MTKKTSRPIARYAVISVGTNSCRLLIAVRGADGVLRSDYHETRGTRLGEGVDETRALRPEAIDRTLTAARDYASLARGSDEIFGIGTSALRDSSNRREFTDRFESVVGAKIELLGGDEEASCSFAGALAGLSANGVDVPASISVVDVGGGSTEIATRAHANEEARVRSLQLGAVRLTESSLGGDPPGPADVERARRVIRAELAGLPDDVRPSGALVAVGGTATTAARMLQELDESSGSGVATIAAADLSALLKAVVSMPTRERMRMRNLPAQRADIFPAGMLIIDEIVRESGVASLAVTDSDLLLGYIARHAKS
jgi:exopolyphosphatase/guanosine-5'-triphosphate,3'-diphosphate pyrophosphatase